MHLNPEFRLRQGVEDAYSMANFLRGTTFRFRNTVFPLILPIENMGFAREDVRIMADESSPWDSPTKDNIVSPCVNVRCCSYPYIPSDRSNEDVGP